MSENQKNNLNDLTKHRLSSMEVHTLVSNLERIELERELRKNPPEIAYFFYMLLGIAFLPAIVYMFWLAIPADGNILSIMIAFLFFGGAFLVDLWYIRACWREFRG